MLHLTPPQTSCGRQAQVSVTPHEAGRATHIRAGQSPWQNGPGLGGTPQDETYVVPLEHTPLAGTA